jgi:hypothetical protein
MPDSRAAGQVQMPRASESASLILFCGCVLAVLSPTSVTENNEFAALLEILSLSKDARSLA